MEEQSAQHQREKNTIHRMCIDSVDDFVDNFRGHNKICKIKYAIIRTNKGTRVCLRVRMKGSNYSIAQTQFKVRTYNDLSGINEILNSFETIIKNMRQTWLENAEESDTECE